MTTDSPVVSKMMELKADAEQHRNRILDTDLSGIVTLADLALWLKNELALNILPMFESTIDAVQADVVPAILDLREDVDEYMLEGGDSLTPETAGEITAVFEQGRQVCNLLEKLTKNADNITRRKAAGLIKEYRTAAATMTQLVAEITVPDDPEDVPGAADGPGDADEPGEPGDTEGPADADEPEQAPAAAPAGDV